MFRGFLFLRVLKACLSKMNPTVRLKLYWILTIRLKTLVLHLHMRLAILSTNIRIFQVGKLVAFWRSDHVVVQ